MVKITIITIVVGILGITIYSGIRYGTDFWYWWWVALIVGAAAAIGWDKYLRKK